MPENISKERFPIEATLQSVYDLLDEDTLLRSSLKAVAWHLRTEKTVKQSISSPRLAPQWTATLLALGAEIIFTEGINSLENYLQNKGPRGGEMIAVQIPANVPGRVCKRAKVSLMPADEPVVSVYAVVDFSNDKVQNARLVLTGVWQKGTRLAKASEILVGEELTEANIEKAATAIEEEVTPVGDYRGSVEYRRAMAGVLTRRALRACVEAGV